MTKEFKHMQDFAIKTLLKDNKHDTIAILVTENDVKVYPLVFENDSQKSLVMTMLKLHIFGHKIKEYYFITETWISQNINMDRPSVDPKKREGLLIALYRSDGSEEQAIQMFQTKKGKVVLEELMPMGKRMESSSAWNFFTPDNIAEDIEKHRKEQAKRDGKK